MSNSTTAIIIQARMTSTRLPGKIMRPLLGRPMLFYQLERLQRVTPVDTIVIATTTNATDDALVEYCQQLHIPVVRGVEHDVLARYYQTAQVVAADVIVRITADCPLIDPGVTEQVIRHFLTHQHAVDYVSNTVQRSYPRGLDTEVFSFAALELAYHTATQPYEREHVTPFFYCHPDQFRIAQVVNAIDYSQHRWTVDTPEDFTLIEHIMTALYPQQPQFAMHDVLQLLKQNPHWSAFNAHVAQKTLPASPTSLSIINGVEH